MNQIKNKTITFSSKKLESGNLQVKFYIEAKAKVKYGYLLVNGSCSDDEILKEIHNRLWLRESTKMDLLRFSFKQCWKDDHQFYLYSS